MISVFLLFGMWAAQLLNGNPVDKAWALLDSGLHSREAGKRAGTVRALGLLSTLPKAQKLAEDALSDSSAEVRVEAASALGEMKAQRARSKLRNALNDKDLKVVVASANALYLLHDPAAYQVYYAMVTGKRKSSEGILQTQLDTLRDRKQVEMMALQAGIGFIPYAGIGWDAWRAVTKGDSSLVEADAAEKLASDPDPKSAHALADALLDKHWQVRAAAANAIGRRGDPALLDAVIPSLLDDKDNVQWQAAAAVLRLHEFERRRARGLHVFDRPVSR